MDTPNRLQARLFLQYLTQAIAEAQFQMAEAHAIVVHRLHNRALVINERRRRLNLSLEQLAEYMKAKESRAKHQSALMVLVPIRRKVIGGINKGDSFIPLLVSSDRTRSFSSALYLIGFRLGTAPGHSARITESTLSFTSEVVARFPLLFPVNYAQAKVEENLKRAERKMADLRTLAEEHAKALALKTDQAQTLYNKILSSGILSSKDIPLLRQLFFGS
jgi:hypothetical protein